MHRRSAQNVDRFSRSLLNVAIHSDVFSMSEPDEATKSVMAAMLLEDRLNAEDAGGVEAGDPDSDSDYGARRRRPPGTPPATLSLHRACHARSDHYSMFCEVSTFLGYLPSCNAAPVLCTIVAQPVSLLQTQDCRLGIGTVRRVDRQLHCR